MINLIIIDNIHIQLVFKNINQRTEQYVLAKIHQNLDPLDENRYRKRQFNIRKSNGERLWDGRVKLCDFSNPNKLLVPIGLFDDLIQVLIQLGYKDGINYQVKDLRQPALTVKLPKSITLDGHGLEKTMTLRDYQYRSVAGAFKEQSGILLEAVNSGKTGCAVAIFKYLLPQIPQDNHLLYIAPSASIMNQVYKKYQHYLGEDTTGIWGDNKQDLSKPIVIATYQTLASAIKEPKEKLTRKRDRLVERIATKYAPTVLSNGSPKVNLRLLAVNFRPKYKYEADDVEILRNMSLTFNTDNDVVGAMIAYQKKYKHLLYKLNKEGYDKYYGAIEFLHSVMGVIVDEAHSAGAISYWNIFQYLINARMRIGMTGTLDKSKKVKMQRIKSLLGKPIVTVSNDTLIKRGVSAKPLIKMVPVDKPAHLEQQIGAIAQQRGVMGGSTADLMMYQIAYKLGVVENQYRNNLIARLAVATAKQLNKQAVLVIVNSIQHGEYVCNEISKYTNNYMFLQGKDDTSVRKEAFQAVKDGKLKILVGTKILDVGIDIPNFRALILCDAGKSYIATIQRIGRVLRIMPTKKKVVIFDMLDRQSRVLFAHAKERIKYYKEEKFQVE